MVSVWQRLNSKRVTHSFKVQTSAARIIVALDILTARCTVTQLHLHLLVSSLFRGNFEEFTSHHVSSLSLQSLRPSASHLSHLLSGVFLLLLLRPLSSPLSVCVGVCWVFYFFVRGRQRFAGWVIMWMSFTQSRKLITGSLWTSWRRWPSFSRLNRVSLSRRGKFWQTGPVKVNPCYCFPDW